MPSSRAMRLLERFRSRQRVSARAEHRVDVHATQPASLHAQRPEVGEPCDADDLRQRLQPSAVARYVGDLGVGGVRVVPEVHLGQVAFAEDLRILVERAARGGCLVGVTARAPLLSLLALALL